MYGTLLRYLLKITKCNYILECIFYYKRKFINFSKEEIIEMITILGNGDKKCFIESRMYAT